MTKTANISKENEIAFIALTNPPMNALSQGVRAGLKKGIEDALSDSTIKAIVIYGKNCNDENVITKYKQLKELGFKNLSIYIGGLFEWLLLQDIYGDDIFPTTSKETDFLKYKSPSLLT